jgi:hypothetical protein
MGFQTSFSIKRNSLSVTEGRAGNDQFLTCGTGTTLSATVWGAISPSTTFWWEQISGPVVTWTTPVNQQTVSFLKNTLPANANLDVQFRFWINKGKGPLYERYSDMWAYSTPTSFGKIGQTITPLVSFKNDDISDFPLSSINVEIVFSHINPTNYQLRWTHPLNPTLITQTDVQQFINGAWETIGVVTGGITWFDPVDPILPHRVIVTKNKISTGVVSNVTQFASPPSVRYPDIVTTLSQGTSSVHNVINSNTIFNVTTIDRTLALLDQSDSHGTLSTSFVNNVNTIYNVNTIERTLIGVVPDDTSFGTVSTNYAGMNVIYNYTVSQLGGVVVGG